MKKMVSSGVDDDENCSKACDKTSTHRANAAKSTDNDVLLSDSDRFYERLGEFFESRGLNLILNARETSLDLFQLHKEVSERGGFHQINKKEKWSDVVSALNLEGSAPTLAIQVQRLYANLLFSFEQSFISRPPPKLASISVLTSSTSKSPALRQDLRRSSDVVADVEGGPVIKKLCAETIKLSTGLTAREEQPAQETSSKRKDAKKNAKGPLGIRSAYQIFLNKECARLRTLQGDSKESRDVLKAALDAWRHLSEIEKQPYFAESRKDRDRYEQEMATYKEQQSMKDNGGLEKKVSSEMEKQQYLKGRRKRKERQNTGMTAYKEQQNMQAQSDVLRKVDDIYKVVALSPDPEASLPVGSSNPSAVEIATQARKDAPADLLLNFNLDELCGVIGEACE